MTDREKIMIEAYIPSPKDESLDDNEYYVKADNGRVCRVYICDIYPVLESDECLYGVRMSSNRRRLSSSYKYNGYPLRQLYDNKQDCKNETHLFYDNWERLREIQKKGKGE